MASLLNLLAPALTTLTRAKTASLEGEQLGEDRKRKTLLDELAQGRLAAQDKRQSLLDELNRKNIESQIADREAPDVTAPRNIDPLSPEGQRARVALEAENKPPAGGGTFTQFTGPDGKPVFFNPQTKESVTTPTGFQPPSPRSGLPTEAERKAAGLLLTGENGYKNLQRLLGQPEDDAATPNVREDEVGGKAAPGFFNRQFSKIGLGVGNIISPDDLRQIDQAAYDLTEAWLRLTSGAAIGRDEIVNASKAIIPQPGDDEATRAMKARSRRLRVDALRQAAGRATDPNVKGQQPGLADDPFESLIVRPPS